MLTMHGGLYLQLRTEGAVQARAIVAARRRRRRAPRRVRRGRLLDRDGHRRLPDRRRCRPPIRRSCPRAKTVERLPGGLAAQLFEVSVDRRRAARGRSAPRCSALVASALARWPLSRSCCRASRVAAVVLTAGFALFPFIMPSSSDARAAASPSWDAVSSHRTLQVMFWAVRDLRAAHHRLHELGLPGDARQGHRRSTFASGSHSLY